MDENPLPNDIFDLENVENSSGFEDGHSYMAQHNGQQHAFQATLPQNGYFGMHINW